MFVTWTDYWKKKKTWVIKLLLITDNWENSV